MSRYRKGKANLDFTEARDSQWQWHQLDSKTDWYCRGVEPATTQRGCRPLSFDHRLLCARLTATARSRGGCRRLGRALAWRVGETPAPPRGRRRRSSWPRPAAGPSWPCSGDSGTRSSPVSATGRSSVPAGLSRAPTGTSERWTVARARTAEPVAIAMIRYDAIQDVILTCARKPTWVSLIYRTETTTKNCKTKNLKSKNGYARSNSKSLGNHDTLWYTSRRPSRLLSTYLTDDGLVYYATRSFLSS